MTSVEEVKEFYNSFPYPSVGYFDKYNIETHADKVLQSAGIKAGDLKGQRVLDLGCGTGEIACSLAFNGANVLGVDFCKTSVERARKLAEEHSLKNIEFIESNLFDLEGKVEGFDFVCLLGVAHHTNKPKKAFSTAIRFLKSRGTILLGLYNAVGRKNHQRIQRKLEKMCGNDYRQKVKTANKMLCNGNAGELEKIYLADKYCHPLEKTVSLKKALEWLECEGIELIGCDPRLEEGKSLEWNERQWLDKERSFFILAGRKGS